MKTYKLLFTWYKPSGKYYSGETEEFQAENNYEAGNVIDKMLAAGMRPGLQPSKSAYFHLTVTTVDPEDVDESDWYPHMYPAGTYGDRTT